MEYNQACMEVEFSLKTWVLLTVYKMKYFVQKARSRMGQCGEKRHGKDKKAVNNELLE